jgi:hypothetical protein
MPEWSLYNSDHYFPVALPGSKATRNEPSSSFSFSPLTAAEKLRPWNVLGGCPLGDVIDIDQTPSTKQRFQKHLQHPKRRAGSVS